MPLVQVDLSNRAKQSKEPYFKIEKTEYQKFFNVRWQSFQGSLSAADKTRHYRLGHGGKRGMEREEVPSNPKSSRLTCDKCSVSYVTEHRLKRHKNETGHKNPGKGRPKKK